MSNSALPAWIWVWAPLLFLMSVPFVFLFFPDQAQDLIGNENGIPDLATPLVLVPAIIFGLRCHPLRRQLPASWLYIWLMLTTIACVYFAGEEISWGQSFFHWPTPEAISRINDQNETNLHNISSWLDQKPRLLLALGVLIGGIVMPLWRKWKGITYSAGDWRYWLWPEFVCLPAGVLAFLVRIPQRYENLTGHWLFATPFRTSELQEFYFGYFLLLYLLSWYTRLNKISPHTPSR